MTASNSTSNGTGVIRVGRKGIRKFAFGEDGEPFEVDVVAAFQDWIAIDESFRQVPGPDVRLEDVGTIKTEDMPAFHQAAFDFATKCAVTSTSNTDNGPTSKAEALDFLARLRECYDELADFFLPKKRERDASPDTSAPGLQFSEEAEIPF